TPADAPALHRLIRENAEHEGVLDEMLATPEVIEAALSDLKSSLHALVAEAQGVAVGCITYFYGFYTWIGKPSLQIADVFVSENYRNGGMGGQLFSHRAKGVIESGCTRREWTVRLTNPAAVRFYNRLNAEVIDYRTIRRIADEKLHALAGEGK